MAYGLERVKRALPSLYRLAQGGTAVGTGLNTKKGYDVAVARQVGTCRGGKGRGGDGHDHQRRFLRGSTEYSK